jgi:3-deoxy-D-manno-octulosonic-acid transferase
MLGSAREGESEILLEALKEQSVEALPVVILAPRHLENVSRVGAACRKYGYSVTYSAGPPEGESGAEEGAMGEGRRAIVVNEMGRLLEYYSISDIGVVGGTLEEHGGHNPLEPASQGAVVVVGPHRDNILDDMDYLVARDAAITTDAARLGKVIRDLLFEPSRMEGLARRAAEAVEARKGASGVCVEAMKARGLLS